MLSVLSFLKHLLAAFLDLLSPRARLAAANVLLRQQLLILQRTARRPRFTPWERRLLSSLAIRWAALQKAVLLVKPATLLRWHRSAWRWWWRRKSKRQPGRPPISPELRSLIRRLWRENTTWGQITIAKYRPRHLDRSRGQAWSTFVRNHLSQIWACDFFTIVSLRFQVLYGFVIIALERRQIVHVGVTAHPTAEWAAQRVIEAVGNRVPPRFLLRNRDGVYGTTFRGRVSGLGIRELVTPPRTRTSQSSSCTTAIASVARS